MQRLRGLREAIDELDKAARKNDVPLLYRRRARLNLECGDFKAALADINRALQQSYAGGDSATGDHLLRGRILLELRRDADALKDFKAARPGPRAYLRMAETLRRLAVSEPDLERRKEYYRAAVEALTLYLKAEPDPTRPASAHRLRGLLLLALQEYARAIPDLDEALKANPDSDLYAHRGWAYLRLNDPQKANPDFEQAIALSPRNGHAYTGRGLARLMAVRDPRDVREAAREAVEDASTAWKCVPRTVEVVYEAACVYAQAAGHMAKVPSGKYARFEYEREALRLLDEVLARGERPSDWREVMRQDPTLNPLRNLPEFKRLLAEPPPL
jgi:tetratricopeptide (TPR) repeat protein